MCLLLFALRLIWPESQPAALTYSYGVHYPNGVAAVNYLYGPDGTWKALDKVEFRWNYYSQYATAGHPYNRSSLINYADGTRLTTTLDINAHLLLDFNHNGILEAPGSGSAFYEHNGRGKNNRNLAAPFTNFWFDDNWLARYMSRAYHKPEPNGLTQYHDFTRWQILTGDITSWSPYGRDEFDTLALDGLYYLSKGEVKKALDDWKRLRDKSGYTYDNLNQRYQYPNIQENYHLGLFKILTDKLLYHWLEGIYNQNDLLQHSISLRSNILSNQERQGSQLYGWISEIDNPATLINTETVAVDVLALGAGGKFTYEAGEAPLTSDNRLYLRSRNVLSAVVGVSSAGYMANGPEVKLPTGPYTVDFFLRAPASHGVIALLEVYDSSSGKVLAQRQVNSTDLMSGNQWTRLSLDINLTNANNRLNYRLYWLGNSNLDLACIQVR
jgi:hypothetical protein